MIEPSAFAESRRVSRRDNALAKSLFSNTVGFNGRSRCQLVTKSFEVQKNGADMCGGCGVFDVTLTLESSVNCDVLNCGSVRPTR